VFLGIEHDELYKLRSFHTVVIDAQYFSAEDIDALHTNGQRVYSYLNVGALEDFRDYYADYAHIALADYDDWPEEKWMDVSSKDWQEFLCDTLAKSLKDKHIDGLFLDNFDIYWIDERNETYEALYQILEGLRKTTELPLIINGADTFVSAYLQKENGVPVFDGVNQENVTTSYDFDRKIYGIQSAEQTQYYDAYLQLCANRGLKVYVLEYAQDDKLRAAAESFCVQRGYIVYVSPSIELTG
jgi:hypothetical protein